MYSMLVIYFLRFLIFLVITLLVSTPPNYSVSSNCFPPLIFFPALCLPTLALSVMRTFSLPSVSMQPVWTASGEIVICWSCDLISGFWRKGLKWLWCLQSTYKKPCTHLVHNPHNLSTNTKKCLTWVRVCVSECVCVVCVCMCVWK